MFGSNSGWNWLALIRPAATPGWLGLGLAVLALGCSSNAPSGGSVIASSGSSSTSAGAGGGVSLQFGGADAGGTSSVAGSGTGGASPAGSAGSAGDVFSATVEKPSYDCRTDLETKDCVSAAGMAAGHGFNGYCADINPPMALLLSPPRWPTACEAVQTFQVDVPVQAPGSFHAMRTLADSAPGIDVRAVIDGTEGDSRSPNFVSAEVAGSVSTDPATGDAIVIGTFHASWSAPDANCQIQSGMPCLAADLNGTFRSDNHLKP